MSVHEEWPLIGRDDELSDIRHALLDRDLCGAIITGPSGMGKTVLAQRAARELSNEFELVYVRGFVGGSNVPYGAINFILGDLDDATVANPLMLLRGLQERYERRPDGRQALFLADNLEDLDSSTSMVLAHLVRVGALKILAVCQSLDGSSEDFGDLWKDGLIRRLDIGPLTLGVTADLLAAALEGPVSRSVAVSIWRTCGGSPLFLQALTREQVDSGEMAQEDGVWVARPISSPRSRRSVGDWISVQVRRLPREEREVLELVSVVGAIRLDLLLRFVDSAPVDALQEKNILRLDLSESPLVTVANGMVGDVVRSHVSPGKSQGLLHRVAQEARNEVGPGINRMSYAAWCLDCGADIDPETLIEAAQTANSYFDPVSAMRFVRSVPGHHAVAAAVVEEARALWIEGDVAGGLRVLDAFIAKDPAFQTLEDWVAIRSLKCKLLVRDHKRYAEVGPLVGGIRERLVLESSSGTSSIAGHLADTELLWAELAAYDGRFPEIVELAGDLLQDNALGDAAFRDQLGGWLAEALTMTGRQQDGRQLAYSVAAHIVDSTRDPLIQEAVRGHLFSICVMTGDWNECLSLIDAMGDHVPTSPYEGSTFELVEGCLLAYSGRGRDALEKLRPALSQLRMHDRHRLLMVGEAAAAYACSLSGDVSASLEHLERIDLGTERLSWRTFRAIQYFSALSSAAYQPPAEVADRLMALADVDHETGNSAQELFFLCQAVQHGRSDAADRLTSLALDLQGPLAQAAALYGKGIASGDAHQLLRSAEIAARIGNRRLAADAAQAAADAARAVGDKTLLGSTEKVLRDAGVAKAAGGPAVLGALTERERGIAVLIAQGATNREIAKIMSVSVRTVEGHVYRLYSKLGVSNRSQLSLILT